MPTIPNTHAVVGAMPIGPEPYPYARGTAPLFGTDQPYTFEFWARVSPDTTLGAIGEVRIGGTIWCGVGGGGSGIAWSVGDQSMPDVPHVNPHEWHLYTISSDPNGWVSLYVDGDLVERGSPPTNAKPGPLQWEVRLYASEVREARIWSTARTAEEIETSRYVCHGDETDLAARLRLAPPEPEEPESPLDIPVEMLNGAHYLIYTNACLLSGGPGGGWVRCGTPADLVFTGTASFTIEAWMSLRDRLAEQAAIVARTDDESSGYSLAVAPDGHILARRGSTSLISLDPIGPGEWTHVAMAYDGTQHSLSLYVNGALHQSSTTASESNSLNPMTPLLLGASYLEFAGVPMSGHLSEVRFWDVARSAEDIASWMDGHPLAADNLRAYYAFDAPPAADLTGQQELPDLRDGAVIEQVGTALGSELPSTVLAVAAAPRRCHEPTIAELKAQYARLRATTSALVAEDALDFGELANIDYGDCPLCLDVVGEHLVLRDNRAAGKPILLAAQDSTDDMLFWNIQVFAAGVDIFFVAVGLRIVSPHKLGLEAVRLLKNSYVKQLVARAIAAASLHGIVDLMIGLGEIGVLWGLLWDLVDLSFWGVVAFVGRILGWALPSQIVILTALIGLAIGYFFYLLANRPTPGQQPDETLTLNVYQAKHGDSILLSVEYGAGDNRQTRSLLVDGGPPGTWNQIGKECWPEDITYACATHLDQDHINGILQLVKALPDQPTQHGRKLSQLWFNVPSANMLALAASDASDYARYLDATGELRREFRDPAPDDPPVLRELRSITEGKELVQAAGAKHVPIIGCTASYGAVSLGPLSVTYRGPQPYNLTRLAGKVGNESEYMNRASIIFLVKTARNPNFGLLMTGDAWDRSEHDVAPGPTDGYKTDIRGTPSGKAHFTFLKVPHHGSAGPESAKSEDEAFFLNYTADFYLISARDGATGIHPTWSALEWLVKGRRALDAAVFSVYCTNDTTLVKLLTQHPQLRPSVMHYHLFVLRLGDDDAVSFDFTVTNGIVTKLPFGERIVELDKWS